MMSLFLTALVGGILGGCRLLKTPQMTFLRLVPWLTLVSTLILMMSGRVTGWVRKPHCQARAPRILGLSRFTSGIRHGGRNAHPRHAGAIGMDEIHTINALKALLTTISNGVVMLFIVSHAVWWPETILMVVALSHWLPRHRSAVS